MLNIVVRERAYTQPGQPLSRVGKSSCGNDSRITHHALRITHYASRITHHALRHHASRITHHASRLAPDVCPYPTGTTVTRIVFILPVTTMSSGESASHSAMPGLVQQGEVGIAAEFGSSCAYPACRPGPPTTPAPGRRAPAPATAWRRNARHKAHLLRLPRAPSRPLAARCVPGCNDQSHLRPAPPLFPGLPQHRPACVPSKNGDPEDHVARRHRHHVWSQHEVRRIGVTMP